MEGFSFKSTYHPDSLSEILFDFLDTTGDHIQDLSAEIIWEKDKERGNDSSAFHYFAGARFKDLTEHQEKSLFDVIASSRNNVKVGI